MTRVSGFAAAAAMALTLGACTYETQRDTLTGAIAGGAVGLGMAAIGEGGAVENLARGAAIGAAAGAARGVAEEIADSVYPRRSYDDGYYQSGQGYDPRYDRYPRTGYGSDPYGGQVVYRNPDPYGGYPYRY